MESRFLFAIVSLFAVMITGCVSTETSDPNVTLTVTDATVAPGDCLFHDEPETDSCHTLTVEVQNDNAEEDFETNLFNWEAVADNGGVYKTPDVDGPDAVAAGGKATLKLHFDVDAGVKLTELRWDGFWAQVTAPIPAY